VAPSASLGLAVAGLTLAAIGFVLWGIVGALGAGLIVSSFDGGQEEAVPVEHVETP
jgi:hypothetical protein